MNEKLPFPENFVSSNINNSSSTLYFNRLSTNTDDSLLITLNGISLNDYRFLPNLTIPPYSSSLYPSKYIIDNGRSITIDAGSFTINQPGKYLYNIEINCHTDVVNSVLIMQLVDINNNVYDGGTLEMFNNVYKSNTINKLIGSVSHLDGDVAKLRITGYIPNSTSTQFNIIISQVNIIINKV